MSKRTVEQLDVREKRVLVRADLNVPIEDGRITDETRIRASLPTIQHLLERRAAVILMSHLGRPKGKVVPELSLKPVAARLGELLGGDVQMMPDCIGDEVEARLAGLKPGQVALLENLRFHPEEEANCPEFAASLAHHADRYVDDAFGAVHREHASVSSQITQCLPSAAGLLLAKEIRYLGMVVETPPRPFYAILGGAKVSDKIAVIQNFIEKVDGLIIGGGMSYTFQSAKGIPIGDSLFDEKSLAVTTRLLEQVEQKGTKLLLPVDYVVTDDLKAEPPNTDLAQVPAPGIPDGWEGVDIGPKTRELFSRQLDDAQCVLWNGPMGVFEKDAFAEGTRAIAKKVAERTDAGAVTILGGGDTAAAAAKLGQTNFSHISTGGGASLEFLGGKELPGIAALPDED